MAGEPSNVNTSRDKTAPYELRLPLAERLSDREAPTGRSPEREVESPGSRLYRIAAPLLGQRDAEVVKQIANMVDSAGPIVAETVAQVWSRQALPPVAVGSSGQGPGQPKSTALIAVLSTSLASLLIVCGVIAALWASDLRNDVLERSREQDAAIVAVQLESTREAAKAAGRQDAQDRLQAEMQLRLDVHDKQLSDTTELVVTLTKHMVSRTDAIGKKTGADQLDTWTDTPNSLKIVALRDDLAREKDDKR